jgi:hypothetical protein
MVGALYSGLINERRRELGLLLAVGMRPTQIVRLILAEAALTTGLGGICGVVLGAGGLILFERSLGYQFERYQVPFALPGPAFLAIAGLASGLTCCAVGVAARRDTGLAGGASRALYAGARGGDLMLASARGLCRTYDTPRGPIVAVDGAPTWRSAAANSSRSAGAPAPASRRSWGCSAASAAPRRGP